MLVPPTLSRGEEVAKQWRKRNRPRRRHASKQIAVGTTSKKYKAVKFSAERVIALYKDGKNVSQIAQACSYPKNTGHNRTRRVLIAAGIYKEAK
jgi:hypothetical protein